MLAVPFLLFKFGHRLRTTSKHADADAAHMDMDMGEKTSQQGMMMMMKEEQDQDQDQVPKEAAEEAHVMGGDMQSSMV